MIKAILVDDENHILEDVEKIVAHKFHDSIEIVGKAQSVHEAVSQINDKEPELLLLDVQLEDGTGFDILNKINLKNKEVIFITGFDHHALKAIKIGALDYILKPVDPDELEEAVSKAIANKNKENYLEKLIEVSQDFFKGNERKRIILKTSDNVYAVYEDEIFYCKSDGNYTTFHTINSERIVVSKPLKKIEELLSEDVFIRCHQSYLVNRSHVIKYHKNGTLVLQMDVKVPVSSRRKDYALKRIFN